MDSNSLVFAAIFIVLFVGAQFLYMRRAGKRMELEGSIAHLASNAARGADATAELSRFMGQLVPEDYRETSLVHRNGTYYGAAFGNNTIILRLPLDRHDEALAEGGERTYRKEWIAFVYDWGTPTPGAMSRDVLRDWCYVARQYAQQGAVKANPL